MSLSLWLLISELFALFVAKIDTMSFVLVSPSQEIALKVVSIVSLSIFFKIDDDKFASVNINPNVVAILGNIIPEPLAMP